MQLRDINHPVEALTQSVLPVRGRWEDDFRAELERVVRSEPFSTSLRMRRFLEYLVNTLISFGPARIKEYTVAIEVFDRPETFDPRSDAIVRVEARRLRDKLDEFYRSEGRAHPFQIRIPRGSYVPEYGPRALICRRIAETRVSTGDRPSIAVLPFAPVSRDRSDGLRQELERRVIYGLLKHGSHDLAVWVGDEHVLNPFGDLFRQRCRMPLVLSSCVNADSGKYRLLLSLSTNRNVCLWEQSVQFSHEDFSPVDELTARLCAETVGLPVRASARFRVAGSTAS